MAEHKTEGQPAKVLEKGRRDFVDVRLMAALPDGVNPNEGVLRLARRLAPGFYLDVGNVCNQYCLYCAVPRDRLYQTSMEDALAQVTAAAALGFHTAIFIGGEPTIWPHLSSVLAQLPDLGVSDAVLTTNGLMLAYPELVHKLVERGVSTIGLSFDDFDPDVQRRLSRREDYPDVILRTTDNLSTCAAHTYFYGVVTSHLAGREESFAQQAGALVARFAVPPAFVLAGLKPVQEAQHRFDSLAISLSDTAGVVQKVIARLDGKATVAFRDIPFCLMPGCLALSLDLYHDNATVNLASGERSTAGFKDSRIFAPQCSQCTLHDRCPGLYTGYTQRFGEGEFAPL